MKAVCALMLLFFHYYLSGQPARSVMQVKHLELADRLNDKIWHAVNDPLQKWHIEFASTASRADVPGVSNERMPLHLVHLINAYRLTGRKEYLLTVAKAIRKLIAFRDDYRTPKRVDFLNVCRPLWRNIDIQYPDPNPHLLSDRNAFRDSNDVAFYALHTPMHQGQILTPMAYLLYITELDPRKDDIKGYFERNAPSLLPYILKNTEESIRYLVDHNILILNVLNPKNKTVEVAYAFDYPQIYLPLSNSRIGRSWRAGSGRICDTSIMPTAAHQEVPNQLPFNEQNTFANSLIYFAEFKRLIGSNKEVERYQRILDGMYLYFIESVRNTVSGKSNEYYWMYKSPLFFKRNQYSNDVSHCMVDFGYIHTDYGERHGLNESTFSETDMVKMANTFTNQFFDLYSGKYYHYWGRTRFDPVKKIEESFFGTNAIPFSPYKQNLYNIIYNDLYLPHKSHYDKLYGGMNVESELQANNPFLKYLLFKMNEPWVMNLNSKINRDKIVMADTDNNGYSELVICDQGPDMNVLRLVDFTKSEMIEKESILLSKNKVSFLTAGDVDGDNLDDIVLIVSNDENKGVLQMRTSKEIKKIAHEVDLDIPVSNIRFLMMGRFNNDVFDDIIISQKNGEGVKKDSLFLVSRAGNKENQWLMTFLFSDYVKNFAVGDFDKDTYDDVALLQMGRNGKDNKIKIWHFDLENPRYSVELEWQEESIQQLSAGDFNMDGLVDLALTRVNHPDLSQTDNQNYTQILFSNRLKFEPGPSITSPRCKQPFDIVLTGNVNGDVSSSCYRGDDLITLQYLKHDKLTDKQQYCLTFFTSGNEFFEANSKMAWVVKEENENGANFYFVQSANKHLVSTNKGAFFKLFDTGGKVVKEISLEHNKWSDLHLKEVQPGIYFSKVLFDSGQIENRKMIIH
jgi:hypothetical protein